jgi:hypothetical protein
MKQATFIGINFEDAFSSLCSFIRVGRAGRFGTKGIAISFVSNDQDREVMEKVRKQFVVKLPELPDELDCSTYSMSFVCLFVCYFFNIFFCPFWLYSVANKAVT